jgi:serine/threonine protein kinase
MENREVLIHINKQEYLVKDNLGEGTHGTVFKVQNVKTSKEIALKVMKSKTEEIKILRLLSSINGFPKILCSFKDGEYECLAFELLGLNLKELKTVSWWMLFLLEITILSLFNLCSAILA